MLGVAAGLVDAVALDAADAEVGVVHARAAWKRGDCHATATARVERARGTSRSPRPTAASAMSSRLLEAPRHVPERVERRRAAFTRARPVRGWRRRGSRCSGRRAASPARDSTRAAPCTPASEAGGSASKSRRMLAVERHVRASGGRRCRSRCRARGDPSRATRPAPRPARAASPRRASARVRADRHDAAPVRSRPRASNSGTSSAAEVLRPARSAHLGGLAMQLGKLGVWTWLGRLLRPTEAAALRGARRGLGLRRALDARGGRPRSLRA